MQVFLNLIDNSINAGASRITISALKDEAKKRATIFIKDDGLGIKKENLSKIFEPFFTTRKEGTGLGLSICRKLIEDHGGSIEVESVENQGTTMKIDFPLKA
jgi:signal transduction histidine kinase